MEVREAARGGGGVETLELDTLGEEEEVSARGRVSRRTFSAEDTM